MAGTRYIVANYMRVLGLTPGDIQKLIGILVEQPNYPSRRTIYNTLRNMGFNCQVRTIGRSELRALNDIVISTIDEDDLKYILILRTRPETVIYLGSAGEIVEESYGVFCSRWTGETLLISTPSFQVVMEQLERLAPTPRIASKSSHTLSDIRKVALTNEPFVYQICRHFSAYLSYLLVRLKIPPNAITILWLLPIASASYLFSQGISSYARLFSVFLIFFAYTLDCCDGEIARITQRFSRIGVYIDCLYHWISGPLLIIGISEGAFKTNHYPLQSGMMCLFFGGLCNYLSVQLNVWKNKNSPYDLFHPLLRSLFWLFPLDINIFVVGAVFNKMVLALKLWEYFSLFLALCMLFFFFREELIKKPQEP